MKYKKRYQECNKIEKLWRRRYYISMFFNFVLYMFKQEYYRLFDKEKYSITANHIIWRLYKGVAQSKMNWVHTMEEVKESIKQLKISKK